MFLEIRCGHECVKKVRGEMKGGSEIFQEDAKTFQVKKKNRTELN